MGADLLITTLVSDADTETFDWPAAHQWLDDNRELAIKRLDLYDPDFRANYGLDEDDEDGQVLYEHLAGCLAEVEESIENEWRTVSWFHLANLRIYVLGETSWGDTPEGFDSWVIVTNVVPEALNAAGFLEGLVGSTYSPGNLPECSECGGIRYYDPCEHCGVEERPDANQ